MVFHLLSQKEGAGEEKINFTGNNTVSYVAYVFMFEYTCIVSNVSSKNI